MSVESLEELVDSGQALYNTKETSGNDVKRVFNLLSKENWLIVDLYDGKIRKLVPGDFKRRLDTLSKWFKEFDDDQKTITVTHIAVSL